VPSQVFSGSEARQRRVHPPPPTAYPSSRHSPVCQPLRSEAANAFTSRQRSVRCRGRRNGPLDLAAAPYAREPTGASFLTNIRVSLLPPHRTRWMVVLLHTTFRPAFAGPHHQLANVQAMGAAPERLTGSSRRVSF